MEAYEKARYINAELEIIYCDPNILQLSGGQSSDSSELEKDIFDDYL